jgi:cyclopropane-fatty-acyl-phospholipid synthase
MSVYVRGVPIDGIANHEARSASKIDVEGSVEGKADHILVG